MEAAEDPNHSGDSSAMEDSQPPVVPLGPPGEIAAAPLVRIRSLRKRPLHAEKLQTAMDQLASILDELRASDESEHARLLSHSGMFPQAEHDGEGENESIMEAHATGDVDPTTIGASGASSDPPGGSPLSSSSSSSHTGSVHTEGNDSSPSDDDGPPPPGKVLDYQKEILRQYDGDFPPLRTLRLRTNDAVKHHHRREESHATSTLGTSLRKLTNLHDDDQTALSQKDQRRVDVLKRRDWIDIPDDAHEMHCLMNGLDPWAASSRKLKTHRWFDDKPMYSPAVLLLAQVSQHQVTAMKRKHGRRGKPPGGGGAAVDVDGAASPGGKNGTLSLDPPMVDVYHPMPKLANAYFDNSIYPMCYTNVVTPSDVERLIVEGENMMKGVEKLQSFVSFRGLKRRSFDVSEDEPFGGGGGFLGVCGSGGTDPSAVAIESILSDTRSCVIISATDAALAFTVFPATPALPLFRPKKPQTPEPNGTLLAGGNPLSRHSDSPFRRNSVSPPTDTRVNYTTSWVQHWQQYLAAEEKRYANPRTAASMYQELTLIHPSGADCRMWVVKRLIRWIIKAKRSLLRYTLLRSRLIYSARKPQAECALLVVPFELTVQRDQEFPEITPRDTETNEEPLEKDPLQQVVSPASAEPAEMAIDPLPLQDSGGVVLVRSSARRELLYNEVLSLPPKPQDGEVMSEEARESLRKAMQDRVSAEVVMHVVVAPTFDPISHHEDVTGDEGSGGTTRTEAPDSLVETITNQFCEVIINLELELRQRQETFTEIAGEVHTQIVESQAEHGGVIQARKRRVIPKSDGVQLGLIKSAATADAQERANPVNSAISLALRKFHDFVVQHVLSSRPVHADGDSPKLASSSSHGRGSARVDARRSPGIVSLREIIARAFRDEHHLTPDWSVNEPKSTQGSRQRKAPVDKEASSLQAEEDAEDPEAAALRAFLKPLFKFDPTFTGNEKATRFPNRLFHPMQMDFLENIHTYDDASLFNLRRRERCCSSAEVIEDISELFQRLVELMQSIDTAALGDDDPFAPNASPNMSQAMSNRKARRKIKPVPSPSAARGGGGGGEQAPTIPRKQFGTVMRVMIDRMVRRLLVNVCQLLRCMTTDGRTSATPMLDLANRALGGALTLPAGLTKETSVAVSDGTSLGGSRRGSLVASHALDNSSNPNPVEEPTFSRITEAAAGGNGFHPQHRLTEFLTGWRWLSHHPSTTQLIWGAGKEADSDRDRLYDRMVAEMQSLQRSSLSNFSAFSTQSVNTRTDISHNATSVLQQFGDSMDSSLSITAPIAVAECLPLTDDDVAGLCSLFPSLKNVPSRLGQLSGSTSKASSGGGGGGGEGTFIDVDHLSHQQEYRPPELSTHVGEEQFLFTLLHIIDLCSATIETVPAIGTDAAAHLRDSHRAKQTKHRLGGGSRNRGFMKGRSGASKASGAGEFRRPVIDVRDTLFFRWRFHIKIRQTDFATDVKHCKLTLFEKSVSRDLLISSLMALKNSLRRLHLSEEEISRLKALEDQRKREDADREARQNGSNENPWNEPRSVSGLLVSPPPVSATVMYDDNDDEPTELETQMAEVLRRRAVQKSLGIEMTHERQMIINAVMSRLNIVIQAITKEERCLMEGVRALLEEAPPSQRDCFLLLQQTFLKEFEKWDAHKSLAVEVAPVPSAGKLSPSMSMRTGNDTGATPRAAEGSIRSMTFEVGGPHSMNLDIPVPTDTSRTMASSPKGLKISIPTSGELSLPTPNGRTPGNHQPLTTSVACSPKNSQDSSEAALTIFSMRCEKCQQRPQGILFRHKNQQRKRVVPLTQDEIELMFDDDAASGVSSPRSRGGSSGEVALAARRRTSCFDNRSAVVVGVGVGDVSTRKNQMRKNLTKVISETCDVFVCDDCFPDYIAQCLIRRLINAMHAAQAAEAADAAAAAAALADKVRKQMRKELFGTQLMPEDATAELFEQVQDAVKRREKESLKRAKAALHADDSDSSSGSSSSDGEETGGSLFNRRVKKAQKKKKKKDAYDDDEFSALSGGPRKGGKGGKGKRNLLEEKLAVVMVGVQKEQMLLQEHTERREVRKAALAAWNKMRVDVARLLYIDQHGCEPESFDDLVRDQSLVIEVDSDDEEIAEKTKIVQDQQAEADRLMSIARQQSQSKIGSFKRADSMVRRASVKFLSSVSGPAHVTAVESVSDPLAEGDSSFGSLSLSATFQGNDEIDAFGLPLLRSASGLTISQLEEQIAAAEADLDENKLMMLKKDLDMRLEGLRHAREELAKLLELQAERHARHEEARRLHKEAKASKQASEAKTKKAAMIRKAASKFLNSVPTTAATRSSTGGAAGDRPTGLATQLSDDEIIQMAEEAKKHQDNTSSRLMRGESRRPHEDKAAPENIFDDVDGCSVPPSDSVPSAPDNYNVNWYRNVGQWKRAARARVVAFRQLCMNRPDGVLPTSSPITLALPPVAEDHEEGGDMHGTNGLSPCTSDVSPPAFSLSPADAKLSTASGRSQKVHRKVKRRGTQRSPDRPAAVAGGPAAASAEGNLQWDEEWFTHKGESDDICSNRDDGLLLMSYLNRLDPLPWCLARVSHTSETDAVLGKQLREALLQSAFVQEAVCVLLDISCGLVRRGGDHPHEEHLDGAIVGSGGTMLEQFGFAHPLEEELFQAIGAPTNSAAVTRALRAIQEHARNSSGGGASSSPIRPGQRRFTVEQLHGEVHRQISKYGRSFFTRLQSLKRRTAQLKLRVVSVELTSREESSSSAVAADTVSTLLDHTQGLPQATDDMDTPVSRLIEINGDSDGELQCGTKVPAVLSSPPEQSNCALHREFTFSGQDAAASSSVPRVPEGGTPVQTEVSLLQLVMSDEEPDSMIQRISPWKESADDSVIMRPDGLAGVVESMDSRHLQQQAPSKEVKTSTRKQRKRRTSKVVIAVSNDGESEAASSDSDGPLPEEVGKQPEGADRRRWSVVKSRGFREKLKQETASSQATLKASEELKLLGCLAEVVLPGLEIVAPDTTRVHPSVTQAWWQLRLLVIALLRFYVARSFLSYRTLWMFSRRLVLKRLQLPVSSTQPLLSRCDMLVDLFSVPYVLEKVAAPSAAHPQTPPPSELTSMPDGGTPNDVTGVPEAASSEGASPETSNVSGSAVQTPAALSSLDPTTDEPVAHPNTDDDASTPAPDEIQPPQEASCETPHTTLQRKYLKPKPLQPQQEQLYNAVMCLYHSHVALAHSALEEYSAGYIRAFSSIPGSAEPLLQPRDCLRMADQETYAKVQRCLLARASKALDGGVNHPEKSVQPFIEDVGRFALAIFVLGPALEARSTLALLGVEACHLAHHMAAPRCMSPEHQLKFAKGTSYSDCVEVVNFLEHLMFRYEPPSAVDDHDSDDEDDGHGNGHATELDADPAELPSAVAPTVDEEEDNATVIDAILHSANETITGWSDEPAADASPRALEEGQQKASPRPHSQLSEPTHASPICADKGTDSKKKAKKTKKIHREVPAVFQKVLAVVDGTLFDTPKADESQPSDTPASPNVISDSERLSCALDSAAFSLLHGASKSELLTLGLQTCLHFLSGGSFAQVAREKCGPLGAKSCEEDAEGRFVIHACRFHVPLSELSNTLGAKSMPPTQLGPSLITHRRVLEHLSVGVQALTNAFTPRHESATAAENVYVGTSGNPTLINQQRQSRSKKSRSGNGREVNDSAIIPRSLKPPHTPGTTPPTPSPALQHVSTPSSTALGPTPTAGCETEDDYCRRIVHLLQVALALCGNAFTAAEKQASNSQRSTEEGSPPQLQSISRTPQRGGLFLLLPMSLGDSFGGSACILHRTITEKHPVSQMRSLEELRKRQRKFSEQLFGFLVAAAPQEAKKLFQCIGAEYTSAAAGSPGLQELLNRTMSDTLGVDSSWSLDEFGRSLSSGRNPLDVLRSSRLSRMSLTDAVAQHLREHFGDTMDSALDTGRGSSVVSGDAPDHQSGNSALVGQASSPFVSKQQRGSMLMEKLLQRASGRPLMDFGDGSLLSATGPNVNENCTTTNVIHTEHLNLTKNVSGLHQSIRSRYSSDNEGMMRSSRENSMNQLSRLSLKINASLGDQLPGSDPHAHSTWDPRISIAAAFDELKAVHKARLKWIRKGDGVSAQSSPRQAGGAKSDDQPESGQPHIPRVSLKNIALFQELQSDDDALLSGSGGRRREEQDRALAASILQQRDAPKELTEQDVKRFRRNRQKSKDMALIDATGLISNGQERLPNEFFVPVMTVATQLMEFSDKTRSDLHWQVPPQWVEDSETFMVVRLDRARPDQRRSSGTSTIYNLEPVVHAAFLYDAFGELVEEFGEEYGMMFSSYRPGEGWVPNSGTTRPSFPWVECRITRRKGIVLLESPLGCYRVSERVLQVLIASADPPRIHVPREGDATALDAFIFDGMDDSTPERSHHMTNDDRQGRPKLPAPQDISSMVDDAALSGIIHRKAMLRRFFMPCTTMVGGRHSYTSKRPFDPEQAIKDALNDHHIDYASLFPIIDHEFPPGLVHLLDDVDSVDYSSEQEPDCSSSTGSRVPWTNLDLLSYDKVHKPLQGHMQMSSPSAVLSSNMLRDPDENGRRERQVKFLPPLEASSSPKRGSLASSPSKLARASRTSPSEEDSVLNLPSKLIASNRLPPLSDGESARRHSAAAVLLDAPAASEVDRTGQMRRSTRVVTKWAQLLPKQSTTAPTRK